MPTYSLSVFSRTITRSTPATLFGMPAYVRAGRTLANTSSSVRIATLTERKPVPTGVVSGPLRPTLFLRSESRTRCGSGVPSACITSAPAFCTSQSISTPVASMARHVAAASSGPMPSPGINVTRCFTLHSLRRVPEPA